MKPRPRPQIKFRNFKKWRKGRILIGNRVRMKLQRFINKKNEILPTPELLKIDFADIFKIIKNEKTELVCFCHAGIAVIVPSRLIPLLREMDRRYEKGDDFHSENQLKEKILIEIHKYPKYPIGYLFTGDIG